jgi:hypothetical protein
VKRSTAITALLFAWLAIGTGALWPPVASAQQAERIRNYDVSIAIESDGSLRVVETIVYDFGSEQRHGIFREIPTRLRYDETYDRIYPLEVRSVSASPGTPSAYGVESVEGGKTGIKIGDPDVLITGSHTYVIEYTVEGALNGFPDHDELYWNAIGTEWPAPIDRATVAVEAPGPIEGVLCFAGPDGSVLPCDRSRFREDEARFAHRDLFPYEGVTVVVGLPKSLVAEPAPILEERWSIQKAFAVTPATAGAATFLFALLVGGVVAIGWSKGRDVRYSGSQVDQVMGSPAGDEQPVPLLEADEEAPVEFAPPEGLRPGEIGTLIDEQAEVLDVTATIVDLAVRGHLQIHEIPKEGWFGKPDWRLLRLEESRDALLPYERKLLDGLFRDGDEVLVSELKANFVERLKGVQDALYDEVVSRGWFRERPDRVRNRWRLLGIGSLLLAVGLAFLLARWTSWGLVGIAAVVGAIALLVASRWMPARTAKGTALVRRARGFRRVIETAETHMARWAEQENVFTRFLPYAVVFGCTDKWAKAFEGLAFDPAQTYWYVSPRPFAPGSFADSMDAFAVTTSGTIASTPSGSGSSGFGGGGFSGGGGGGGGGGSW